MAGLNETPRGERVHIGVFGRTNAGKSTLVNTLCGSAVSLVSEMRGTTTDPVYKSMELLPVGPVVVIDTPGLDDESEIGAKRIERTLETLQKTDLAVLVIPGDADDLSPEQEYLQLFRQQDVPAVVVINQRTDAAPLAPDKTCSSGAHAADSESSAPDGKPNASDSQTLTLPNAAPNLPAAIADFGVPALTVNAANPADMGKLARFIASAVPQEVQPSLTGDLVNFGDLVVLVMPQDIQAPKGRLILPQVRVLRDLLDHHCQVICVGTDQLKTALARLSSPPDLVITDSQAFREVDEILPRSVRLTSFSILLSKEKGEISALIEGARAIDTLQDGDRVLILEACTHHALKGDIAREKLPRWITEYTGKQLSFDVSSGSGFPAHLADYKLELHCGGCMINRKNMLSRIRAAQQSGVSVTNFGVAIAHMNGILDRVCY